MTAAIEGDRSTAARSRDDDRSDRGRPLVTTPAAVERAA
jgi:hypothetical protein